MLAEYVIALADLVEAEGRAMRRGLALVGWAFAFIAVAAVLLMLGLALWIWSLYLLLALLFPAWLSAALVGAIVLGFAGVIAWLVARSVR